MKKLLRFLSIALLVPSLISPALAQATSPQPSDFKFDIDLLSDTGGSNMNPYMKNLASTLRKNWLPLATEAANQPLPQNTSKQQETLITFTIASDGHISAMQSESPTPRSALDAAAWNATKATTYLPPPPGVKDRSLKLRVHFMVN